MGVTDASACWPQVT